MDYWKKYPKEAFDEWYRNQNRFRNAEDREKVRGIVEGSMRMPEMVKKEDNRSIETYRRAVQDRDGHTKNIGNDAYLTVKEAALLAGINPETVHKWIKKGKIEAVQSSKTVRIPRQAFENWLQSRKKEDQHGINC